MAARGSAHAFTASHPSGTAPRSSSHDGRRRKPHREETSQRRRGEGAAPASGHRPPPHNPRATQEFFSAKLVVGGDDKPETLLPISYWKEASEDEEATATFAYYCAEPGVKFQVKCSLLRPPPEGVSYGARVYVDRGEPDTVYTSAAVEGCVEINQCVGCFSRR